MRGRKKRGGVGVVHESGAKPGFVGGVLEEAADEIRHAGNHLADRDVLANPEAHLARGLLQFRGHPVEHLKFEGGLGQADLLELGDRGPDRSGVVASEGEFDAALSECRGVEWMKARAIRSKQASESDFRLQTGTGQPISSAWIVS